MLGDDIGVHLGVTNRVSVLKSRQFQITQGNIVSDQVPFQGNGTDPRSANAKSTDDTAQTARDESPGSASFNMEQDATIPLTNKEMRERLLEIVQRHQAENLQADDATIPLASDDMRERINKVLGRTDEVKAVNPDGLRSDIAKLKDEYQDIEQRIQLKHYANKVTALREQVRRLPEALYGLRQRGYRGHDDLEQRITTIRIQCEQFNKAIRDWLAKPGVTMSRELQHAHMLTRSLDTSGPFNVVQYKAAEELGKRLATMDEHLRPIETHLNKLRDDLIHGIYRIESDIVAIAAEMGDVD